MAEAERTLVIGEALVDIVSKPGETATEHVGGSPANVALTLARLEDPVTLLTSLGADDRGEMIRNHLQDNGVEFMLGKPTADKTSTAKASLGDDGAASYDFDLSWELPEAVTGNLGGPGGVRGFRCLHTGSIAAVFQPGGDQVRRIISSARDTVTISYDPNTRPAIMGEAAEVLPTIENFVRMADVVKLSDEDAEWLSAGQTEGLLARWQEMGPSVLVMTRGRDGALGICAQGRVEVEGVSAEVEDTVGAGDSYAGALIHALGEEGLLGADRREDLRGITTATLEKAMGFAASVAAVTVSRPGADPPRLAELD